MKTAIFALIALSLAACAPKSSIEPMAGPALNLSRDQTAHLTVTTDVTVDDQAPYTLFNALKLELIERRAFRELTGDRDAADIALYVTITDVDGVSSWDRRTWGALAGRATITAKVEVTDVRADQIIGVFSAAGKSASDNINAGTTPQAMDQISRAIVSYLMGETPGTP